MRKALHGSAFSCPEAFHRRAEVAFGLLPMANPNIFPNISGRLEPVAVKSC